MGAPVVPETVLQELHRLWTELGEGEVLRTCTMTLLVSTSGDARDGLDELLAELMQAHPSRTILLRCSGEGEAKLESTVRALCWKPFGNRQQVCCELIDIDYTVPRQEGVVNLLRGLLAPDLPVVLWLRGGPEPAELLALASLIVVDSRQQPDARAALEAVWNLRAPGRRVADLAWTRLTPWRKMVAGLFDGMECRQRIQAVDRVAIEHRGPHAPSTAYYLGAWLAAGLGGRVAVELQPAPSGEFPQGTIHSVRLRAPEFEIALRVTGTTPGTRRIELQAGGLRNHMVLPARRDSDLVVEELSIMGADAHFENALRGALELAGGRG